MDLSSITVAQTVTHAVDEDGEPTKEVGCTDARYSCGDCGMSWGADQWPDVALHCLVEHAAKKSGSKRKGK